MRERRPVLHHVEQSGPEFDRVRQAYAARVRRNLHGGRQFTIRASRHRPTIDGRPEVRCSERHTAGEFAGMWDRIHGEWELRLRLVSRQNATDGGNFSRERVGEIECRFTTACARHFPHQVVRQVARPLNPFRGKCLIRRARVAFRHTGNLPLRAPVVCPYRNRRRSRC
jgi:hypothetical protein